MRAAKLLLVAMAVLVAGTLVAGGCIYSGYNRAIRLDETVKNNWAQIENQLQRRYDLIPNLIETVKGVAGHEEKIFLGVAEARKAYFSASGVSEKAKAATGLESALSRLLVLREQYPELKANESFRDLMVSLEGSENRLAVERKRYNDSVSELNVYTRQIIGRICSGLAGVESAEYFEIEEAAREAPKVDFNKTP